MHFSTWAMKKEFDYNLEYFNKCLIQEESFEINPSLTWSDDSWYLDQENRDIKNND
jgi:muramoyltetrapeptide carboxypeptidase